MPKISTRDWQAMAAAIEKFRDFHCHGAVAGKAGDPKYVGYTTGRLSRDLEDKFASDVRAARVDYVIYSYSTPMAWRNGPTGWTINSDKYSVTTTRHQSAIGAAVGRASGEF